MLVVKDGGHFNLGSGTADAPELGDWGRLLEGRAARRHVGVARVQVRPRPRAESARTPFHAVQPRARRRVSPIRVSSAHEVVVSVITRRGVQDWRGGGDIRCVELDRAWYATRKGAVVGTVLAAALLAVFGSAVGVLLSGTVKRAGVLLFAAAVLVAPVTARTAPRHDAWDADAPSTDERPPMVGAQSRCVQADDVAAGGPGDGRPQRDASR